MHTMAVPTTILPQDLRDRLTGDAKLGCGNFLHAAVSTNPEAARTFFHLDRPCRTFLGESYDELSLLSLKAIADQYAAWYYAAGVRPKELVAVYVGEGIENLIHYVALTGIGAVPSLVNGNMPADIAALFVQKIGATALYTDESHLAAISPHLKTEGLRFVATNELAAASPRMELPKYYPFRHDDKDTVLVGHSSGTTGIPKAVIFQHQQFFYGIRYRLGLPRAEGSERILSALPHSHSAGIAYVMLAALSGTPVMVLSNNRPETVLPAIERFRPTMVVAFPETYVELCEADMGEYDLTSIRLWFNGGDAAHEAHIRKLTGFGTLERNGKRVPGSVFIDGLGSSEMGFSLFRAIHTPESGVFNRCIGKPLDWVDATVLDEDGNRLPPFRVGKLGVKSPTITPGYWNDSGLTEKSRLSGYWLTGDMFYYDEEGRFFHVDRVPDVIRTGQGPVYSLQTEELLMKHCSDLADCTVVGVAGGRDTVPVAFVRLKQGNDLPLVELEKRLNSILKEQGKRTLEGIFMAKPGEIPLGPTGKVLKRELREKFHDVLSRRNL